MVEKLLYSSIKKQNRGDIRWAVLWLLLLLTSLLEEAEGTETIIEPAYLIPFGLLFLFGYEFYEKGTRLADHSSFHVFSRNSDRSLGELLRTHSFPVRSYYRYFTARLLPYTLIAAVENLIIFSVRGGGYRPVLAVSALLMPPVYGFLGVVRANHRLSHSVEIGWAGTLEKFFRVCVGFCTFLWCVIGISTVELAACRWAQMNFVMDSIPQSTAASAYLGGEGWRNAIHVAICLFAIYLLDKDNLFLPVRRLREALQDGRKYLPGRSSVARIVCGLVTVGCFVGYVREISRNHTILTEQAIMVKEEGREHRYSFGDIGGYEVGFVEEWDEYRMTLELTDGRTVEISNHYDHDCYNTEAWKEHFDGSYNYILWLCEYLRKH